MSFPWKSFETRLGRGLEPSGIAGKDPDGKGQTRFKAGVLKRQEGEFHHFRIAQKFSPKSERCGPTNLLDLRQNSLS